MNDVRASASDWSSTQVATAVSRYFSEEHTKGEVEGPAKLGQNWVWRVWTWDGTEYHAHYVLAQDGKPLKFFEDFNPFALWLADAFDREKLADERKMEDQTLQEWWRILIASLIILAFMGLLIWQVVWQKQAGFSVNYVVTALLGAGVTYLLSTGARRERR